MTEVTLDTVNTHIIAPHDCKGLFSPPSAGHFDKADGRSLWPASWELQGRVWWFHRQIRRSDSGVPLIVGGAPHHLHSAASLPVRGAAGPRSVTLHSESVLAAPLSHCRPSADNAEPSLPSDCESCRTLAVLSRLTNGPNSTQPETSSFLQSVCFHYPNAIPKVWPPTSSENLSGILKTNVRPSCLLVWGLHQGLRSPPAEGFREPNGRQTRLRSKNKALTRQRASRHRVWRV